MSLVGFKARNHPQQRKTDDVDDRGTPLDLFTLWNARFDFTVDVAAAAHNTKCARYFTRDDDGLSQSWADESVWCNPPYSDISAWVVKAWAEHPLTRGVVMLLPANRTEQTWWRHYVEPFRDRPGSPLTTEFLPGRIRFHKAGDEAIKPNERPPFGCCLVIWARPMHLALSLQQTLVTS